MSAIKSKKAQSHEDTQKEVSANVLTVLTNNYEINSNVQAELSTLQSEIKGLLKQTLENVIRLGQIFKHIKEDLLPQGEWVKWFESNFGSELSRVTVNNFINVYELHNSYKDKYSGSIESLSLRTLYKLGSGNIEPALKETVLDIGLDQEVSEREADTIIKTYRQIKMAHAGLAPEAVKMLTTVEIAEKPKELAEIQRLSKPKQLQVARIISEGLANTPKEALKFIGKSSRQQEEQTNAQLRTVDYEVTRKHIVSSLADIPDGAVNLAVIEAPLKFDFVDLELPRLSKEVYRILQPGGFAIITLGHKAIMYAGDALSDLVGAHVLCLRRQPGNSRTIVGLNITSASVFAVLAYRPPYKAPSNLIVDLQTIDQNQVKQLGEYEALEDLTDTEAFIGLDEVHSGLEKCFEYFLDALSLKGDLENQLLHHIVESANHFNIDDYLYNYSTTRRFSHYYSSKIR